MATWPRTGKSREQIREIARGSGGPNPYAAARTFQESEVSVSHTKTVVPPGGGHIQLGWGAGGETSIADMGGYSAVTSTGDQGAIVNPNLKLGGITAHLSSYFDNNKQINLETPDGNVVDYGDCSPGGSVRLTGNLYPGQDYHAVVYVASGGVPSFDKTPSTNDIDVTGGIRGDSTNDSVLALDRVEAIAADKYLDGTAFVEWTGERRDLYEWDTATYTATQGDGNVTVYIQHNDGSGWTRANGGEPVSRNYSLNDDGAISPPDDVRFEFVVSRPNGDAIPTVDSAIISWFL